ncbi:MAG: peptidoglycan editing factor PgeF [Streptosporangiales bacterium]|nr:peptidoglycan editing factor PgeF [Streptosporangiales bacterium]
MVDTFDLGSGGACAAFTDRHGGVSARPYDELNLGGGVGDDPTAVAANRARAAEAFGLDPRQVVWMRQVHSNDVACVDGFPDGRTPRADALVTDVSGLALAVLAADCAPVLLTDPVAGTVGAAHAGRPGVARGVVPALVNSMIARGARPDRMVAAVGPAVCGGCYEVPPDMQQAVASAVPETRCTTRRGTPGLDIRAGVVAQLEAAGITQVTTDRRCTAESPELYSYRRDGRTGRFAGYVWLRGG